MRWTYFACLAVLVLSSLTFADSIDYQAAGTLAHHTAFTRGAILAGHSWEAGTQLIEITDLTTGRVEQGNLGILDVTTGTLSRCPSGLCFTGGTLDIDNLAGKDIVFGKLLSGTISTIHGIAILSATLSDGATTVIRDRAHQAFSSQALISQHVAIIPEPTTLTLVGSGLLGLGFMRRWRV